MKNLLKTRNSLRSILLIAIMFAASHLNGQHIKPSASGYAPVNGIQVYYELYGEGRPIVLLHGAFYTIDMNWGELIPELSKTRKVIAIEMQGHGHSPFSERKLVIISSTYKTSGWMPIVNSAFDNFKPEFFDNTPLQTGYDAVAPDKTKWRKYLEQMFDFAKVPFNVGDSNIAKITAPVLIIAGDNDGLDKIELIKTYQLLGGGVVADMQPMPKSQLAIVPSQGHVSLMMQTTTILNYLNSFLK
jgi:pimeloyl-ACP methyl ester carboxylesterase